MNTEINNKDKIYEECWKELQQDLNIWSTSFKFKFEKECRPEIKNTIKMVNMIINKTINKMNELYLAKTEQPAKKESKNDRWKVCFIAPDFKYSSKALKCIYKLIENSNERVIHLKDKSDIKEIVTDNISYTFMAIDKIKTDFKFHEIYILDFSKMKKRMLKNVIKEILIKNASDNNDNYVNCEENYVHYVEEL